jgi:hypothetical protein
MRIDHIQKVVSRRVERLTGRPPAADPASSPVLASVRAGEARRLAAERDARQAAASTAPRSHTILASGRVVPHVPIQQPPPGSYRDSLVAADEAGHYPEAPLALPSSSPPGDEEAQGTGD